MSPKLKADIRAALVSLGIGTLTFFLTNLLQMISQIDWGQVDSVASSGAAAATALKMRLATLV